MPTTDEFKELKNNCRVEWVSRYGIYGRLFTSNINGNELFFPASGFYNGTSLGDENTAGYCWASTWESATNARGLSFTSQNVNAEGHYDRRYGFPVRAVRG